MCCSKRGRAEGRVPRHGGRRQRRQKGRRVSGRQGGSGNPGCAWRRTRVRASARPLRKRVRALRTHLPFLLKRHHVLFPHGQRHAQVRPLEPFNESVPEPHGVPETLLVAHAGVFRVEVEEDLGGE